MIIDMMNEKGVVFYITSETKESGTYYFVRYHIPGQDKDVNLHTIPVGTSKSSAQKEALDKLEFYNEKYKPNTKPIRDVISDACIEIEEFVDMLKKKKESASFTEAELNKKNMRGEDGLHNVAKNLGMKDYTRMPKEDLILSILRRVADED